MEYVAKLPTIASNEQSLHSRKHPVACVAQNFQWSLSLQMLALFMSCQKQTFNTTVDKRGVPMKLLTP